MADLVETMASFGKTWHGKENLLGAPQKWEDMLRLSGLDWEVKIQPVYAHIAGVGEVKCPDSHAVVRMSDHKPLGVVGNKYRVIQNAEAGQFLDELPLIGEMEYHTAGSLRGGKTIFVLGKLTTQDFEPIPGDLTNNYVLATNCHDGTGSFRVLVTSVRVVCNNTLNLALTAAGKTGLAIRHIGNPRARLEEAQRVLGFATEEVKRYRELCLFLTKQTFSQKDMEKFVADLIPEKVDANGNLVVSGKARTQRDKILELAESGAGTSIPGVRGTRYGMLQAVTEYTSHYLTVRGGGSDTETRSGLRQAGAWFGAGDKMNQQAQKMLASV